MNTWIVLLSNGKCVTFDNVRAAWEPNGYFTIYPPADAADATVLAVFPPSGVLGVVRKDKASFNP